jgi:hypothetical protein
MTKNVDSNEDITFLNLNSCEITQENNLNESQIEKKLKKYENTINRLEKINRVPASKVCSLNKLPYSLCTFFNTHYKLFYKSFCLLAIVNMTLKYPLNNLRRYLVNMEIY